MTCDLKEFEVTANIDFVGCREHGDYQPGGGSLSMGGVPTGYVLDAMLGILEETLIHELESLPKVQALINYQYEPTADGEVFGFEDRTKRLLMKLLAHQLLLGRVASRSYVTTGTSAILRYPADG